MTHQSATQHSLLLHQPPAPHVQDDHMRQTCHMHHMRLNGHMFQTSHDTLVKCVMTKLSIESRHTNQMSHGTPMREASASSVCISHVAVCETLRLGQHTHTHTHTHAHTNIHTHIHIYTHTYIYTRHIYMCLYVCLALGACGQWHLSKHTHTHTHTRIYIYICIHMYIYTYICRCIYIRYIYMCAYTYIYIYTYT